MAKKLTVKQQKFADEYIISGNATEAAKRAGYAERSARSIGQENLTKPDIKNYIEERLEQLMKESIAEQDEVLQYLTSIMRGEDTEEILRGVGDGEQVIDDIAVSAKDRIKAAELLGKRYSLFTDKKEITGSLGLVQIIDDIPDDPDD